MRIVEIKSLPNGGHRNQSGPLKNIPEGWAVIPKEIKTENFPFGDITVTEIDGVMTVTNWTPREIPMAKEPENKVTPVEQLRADVDYIAIMTGVEL